MSLACAATPNEAGRTPSREEAPSSGVGPSLVAAPGDPGRAGSAHDGGGGNSLPNPVFGVTRVVDGDTLEIDETLRGGTDTVALLGVDAPEEGEPLADEAASFVEGELEGLRVGMTHDARLIEPGSQETLVYVWLLDGVMLNARLVREGYAQVDVEPPNVLHADSLAEHQEAARVERRGIWGLPPGQRCLLADRGNGVGRGSRSCGAGAGGGR